MVKGVFPNLAVRDLEKSKKFFSDLGFKFNPKFTDDNAACLVIAENVCVMLLTEKFFKSFLKNKELNDLKKTSELILGLQVDSRKEVDEMMKKAFFIGAKAANGGYDHGFMYGNSFADLDGHIWEIFFMDEANFPKK